MKIIGMEAHENNFHAYATVDAFFQVVKFIHYSCHLES